VRIFTLAVVLALVSSCAAPAISVAEAAVPTGNRQELAAVAKTYGSSAAYSAIVETVSGPAAAITHAESVSLPYHDSNGAVAVALYYVRGRWVPVANVIYDTLQGVGAVSTLPPQSVNLTGATDFLVSIAFAGSTSSGVFSDVGGRWHMVPFPSGELVSQVRISRGVVLSYVDNCNPDCAQGKEILSSFVYDPATASFVSGSTPISAGPVNPRLSRIATALPTPADAFPNVGTVAVNGGIAAVVAMLLTFPSSLFNETFLDNYADIKKWRRKWSERLRLKRPLADPGTGAPAVTERASSSRRDRKVFVLVLLVGALVNSFNDGGFGVSLGSLFTFISVTLALLAGITVTATVTGLYHSRSHGKVDRRLAAFPMGLAIAVFFVVFSRLIDFEPGYLYGIVCGVLFARELKTKEEGHVAALSVLATMATSVVAWLLWVPVDSVASKPGAFFGAVIADDFLAAVFVSGLVGSFFGMIPIRGLPGFTIKRWSWSAWVIGFVLAVFGLFEILLRPGVAGHGHRPLILSVALFVGFGIASIVFHEHFENKKRRAGGSSPPRFGERVKLVVRDARAEQVTRG
jgi:hypothetical protein